MKYVELANAGVLRQPVYRPGKPIEYVAREYGLEPTRIAKLASNENPFGPSPRATEAVRAGLSRVHLYPDGGCHDLRQAIATDRGVTENAVLVGHGSNEIIELLGHVFLRPGVEVVMGAQAFIVYKLVTRLFGATPIEVPMRGFAHDLDAMRAAVTERTRLLFLASPNNPTGAAHSESELLELAESLPDHVVFCLDEAYAEYLDDAPDLRAALTAGHKVIRLRTFSKIYGLGGLRVGYGYGDPELIDLLQRVRQPFNVNSLAQTAAVAALNDREFVVRCRRKNEEGRRMLCRELAQLGIEAFGGQANFILVKVGDGKAFFEQSQKKGLIVRPLIEYGMPEYIRVSIGRPEDNERFLSQVGDWIRMTKNRG